MRQQITLAVAERFSTWVVRITQVHRHLTGSSGTHIGEGLIDPHDSLRLWCRGDGDGCLSQVDPCFGHANQGNSLCGGDCYRQY